MFTATWVVTGGGISTSPLPFYLMALTGSWLLGYTLTHGGAAAWQRMDITAKLATGLFCLLPLLQCIPLPPTIWHELPGRSLTVETLSLVGRAQAWHPITLTFEATFKTFLLSLWLMGLLLAVICLSAKEQRALFALLLALGALHIAIGITQLATHGSLLFYSHTQGNFLLGLFANKNHSALFIATLFPIGYFVLLNGRDWEARHLPITAAACLLLFAMLILTFSRAGFVLGLIAFAFVALLAARWRLGRTGGYIALATMLVLVLLVVLASTNIAMQSFGRFAVVGDDPRWLFWQWSWDLVPIYFPAGSGIGSFPEVFQVLEHLEWVKPTYLNHAHNEYLEQLIEIGIAAPILWVSVAVMLTVALRRVWRRRTRSSGRLALAAAVIVFLVFIHSAFDYPLRRPGLAVVFVIALGALLRGAVKEKFVAKLEPVCEHAPNV